MKRILFRRTQRLIIWLGLLPILLAFAAYRYSSQHVRNVTSTLSSDDFILSLDDLLSTVKDAETGQRGYLLTGNPSYAAPFRQAEKTIGGQLNHLGALAGIDKADAQTLAELRTAVADRMNELVASIYIHNTQGPRAALEFMNTNRGEVDMNIVRKLVKQLRDKQMAIFRARLEDQRKSRVGLDITLIIGVLLSFLSLYLAYHVNVMYAEERDRTEANVLSTNELLEARVKERTAELEERTRDLQKSNADLTQFAYVASHDLQEPLRMVGSYVGLLARRYRGKLDETADEYIQFAVDGATRMQALISDLLVYSRAGTQAVQKEPVPFANIVQRALANLSLAISEVSAVIHCGELPVVQADAVKLSQVLQNLIGNAVKFRKPGTVPEITILATKVGYEWMFSIGDNGIGFDTRYTEKIFQVFQRLHGVGKYSGNGIGLAISKRIVEHHGGRLWADSQLGVGSTFFFTLPVFTETEKNLTPEAASGLQTIARVETAKNGDTRVAVRNTVSGRQSG
jgi:signal transduction histidine kinase